MPWLETDAVNERMKFVLLAQEKGINKTELCERFGISRETGHLWIRRFKQEGIDGLKDRSRAPHSCPHKTPDEVLELFLDARRGHPTWGPKKLIPWLMKRHPGIEDWPSASTVSELFRREGLSERRRRKRKAVQPDSYAPFAGAPNDTWCADFKGDFLLLNGDRCYPLTITDLYSRKIILCRAHLGTHLKPAMNAFELAFREFGLPRVIRTDNGVPFVGSGSLGLSKLNVWFRKLGIQHQRTRPGSPQDNGSHERMHKTLKQETCLRPRSSIRAQQQAFKVFVEHFNKERPHEALDFLTPDEIYVPSPRIYRSRIPEYEYPAHFTVKTVTSAGTIRLGKKLVTISQTLTGERIGLEEIHDGIWNIVFHGFLLATLDEETYNLI